MSVKSGLDYSENGLIFAFDTNDTNTSYLGEPTTNIAYATNNYLNSNGNWWINGGNTDFNDNDTSIPKPVIPNVDTSNLRIFSSTVTAGGSNQHIGSSIIPVAPSLQYAFSIYFWFQGSTLQAAPYVRTAVNNNSIGTFAYNGDTNYLNWPRQKWIRLTAVVTTQSNETGIYMSSYTGDYVGEKVAYFGYQVEQKSHVTPLVLGTRSVTNNLIDVTGNSTIDLTHAGYINDGVLYFDGTNDWGTVTNGPLTQLTQNQTLVSWFEWYGDTGAPHRTLICTSPDYRAGLKLMSYYHGSIAAWVGNNNGTSEYLLGGGATPTGWNMLACTRSTDGQLKLYLNGVLVNSASTGFYGGTYLGSLPMIGGEYHSKYLGEIPMALAYNRVLGAPEILEIYNRTRVRYENRGCYLC
jgi:hypothetical protein